MPASESQRGRRCGKPWGSWVGSTKTGFPTSSAHSPVAAAMACLQFLAPEGRAAPPARCLCSHTEHEQGMDSKWMATTEGYLDTQLTQKPSCCQKTLAMTSQFNIYLLKPDIVLVNGDLELKSKPVPAFKELTGQRGLHIPSVRSMSTNSTATCKWQELGLRL